MGLHSSGGCSGSRCSIARRASRVRARLGRSAPMRWALPSPSAGHPASGRSSRASSPWRCARYGHRGAGLLAVYSAGLGIPFVVAALFAGALRRLPQALPRPFRQGREGDGWRARRDRGLLFLTGGMQRILLLAAGDLPRPVAARLTRSADRERLSQEDAGRQAMPASSTLVQRAAASAALRKGPATSRSSVAPERSRTVASASRSPKRTRVLLAQLAPGAAHGGQIFEGAEFDAESVRAAPTSVRRVSAASERSPARRAFRPAGTGHAPAGTCRCCR